MAKYETLDLSGICNIGLKEFSVKPAFGLQEYRGVPFAIGDGSQDSSNLFLKLDSNSGPVRIKVDKANITQSFNDVLRVSNVRWLPPSNSMSTNATALRRGPT